MPGGQSSVQEGCAGVALRGLAPPTTPSSHPPTNSDPPYAPA